MARVTIEDCLEVVGNRFALASVAMKRARQIVTRKAKLIEREKILADASGGIEIPEEIPSAEVVEKNLDKSSVVHEEHKPILSALKEVAENQVGFSFPGKD